MPITRTPLRIGVSASLVAAGTHPTLAMGLPCLVMLESLAHWVMSKGDLSFLIPTQPGAEWNAPNQIEALVETLDGLVLQGGADVCPRTYGEEPRHQDWCGDPRRDRYEMDLIEAFLRARKPILGICRGMQLLNVALGGSLIQDIPQEFSNQVCHRGSQALEAIHRVEFTSGGALSRLYGGEQGGPVVSAHHQAVKRLGRGLCVEARSSEDGLVEAIRLQDDARFAWGLQWHPEIQPPGNASFLDPTPILEEFRSVARARASELSRTLQRAG